MKRIEFDFLNDLELEEVSSKASPILGKIDRQPEGKCIRLFSDGKAYPSQELIDSFNLQYQDKNAKDPGNGLDVFAAQDWAQWPASSQNNIVFVTAVSRNEPKVDLFSQTRHDEKGKPKSDVATQGTGTFGSKVLIDLLNTVYEDDFFGKGRVYLDLEVMTDKPLKPINNNVYHIPKMIQKGTNKGKHTYERRENLVIYPLVPIVEESTEVSQETIEKNESVVIPQGENVSKPVFKKTEDTVATDIFK